MAVDVRKDSDSGYLGGGHMHPETWRVHGNEAQMVDTSEHGPLGLAEDDMGVNSCERSKWPNAPGFKGGSGGGGSCRSGALDGAVRPRPPARGAA